MNNILFLICAISLFAASFVSVAHAHADDQNTDLQIELSIDQNSADNISYSDPSCDMHCHNHIAPTNLTQVKFPKAEDKLLFILSENAPYSPIYGLKRPPKI